MMRILLLGGTADASRLAGALARARLDAVYSYAGRTSAPTAQPLPTRVGGFGGVPGLVAYLSQYAITHVIDATHPFAATMSANAIRACAEARVPLLALERGAWVAVPGDLWIPVPDVAAAVRALPEAPARVFLAIGRQQLDPFAAAPAHHYLVRVIDPPEPPPLLPRLTMIRARGPFTRAGDLDLMRAQGTQIVVAKNAGGDAARSKLDAARELGLPVIMIARPAIPPRPTVERIEDVLAWLGAHGADLGV